MSRRIDRINGLLREEISQLLSREIKDPRLNGVITITQVQISGDLRIAKVYVSVMGDDNDKQNALKGIESATTFIRRGLRERLTLRHVPALKFLLDESIEQAEYMLHILDDIKPAPFQDVPRSSDRHQAELYNGPLSFPSLSD